MLKNYFITALRTIFRNKLYSAINIVGLTFGLSCFLLIGLYLFDELTYDQQHSKADRIYRVIEHKTVNGESTTIAGAGYQLAQASKKSIPAVENTTKLQRIGRANILNPQNPENFLKSGETENFFKSGEILRIRRDMATLTAPPLLSPLILFSDSLKV